jgi:hypothetical protein
MLSEGFFYYNRSGEEWLPIITFPDTSIAKVSGNVIIGSHAIRYNGSKAKKRPRGGAGGRGRQPLAYNSLYYITQRTDKR